MQAVNQITVQIGLWLYRFPRHLYAHLQHLEADYGLYTWPCAPILAQYVSTHRNILQGAEVVELGSGTGVPGLVAAKCGAHVTLTDRPCIVENLKAACRLNGLADVKVVPLTWGIFTPDILALAPPGIILASDCFYESQDFEDILATVNYFMDKNPRCRFWTAYQERSSNRTLSHLLERWNLSCKSIPLESFMNDNVRVNGLGSRKLSLDHTIYMWEITRK